MIDECNILSALDEGLYTMSETIATILGTLKAHKMNFNSLLKATTQKSKWAYIKKDIPTARRASFIISIKNITFSNFLFSFV